MIRAAGAALNGLGGMGKWLFKGMGKADIAMRLAPDLFFGGLAAAQTPGDIGDKIIAGGSSAIGGSLGGLALGKLAGNNQALGTVLDMAGSVGGDFAGMATGDQLMRGKDMIAGGAGQTPWERMGADQQAQLAADLKQQIMMQYGLIPGTREQYAQMQGVDGLS